MDASQEQAVHGRDASMPFQQFEEELKGPSTPEEKIASGLKFMRDAISQEGSPNFREFWEARRHILTLFKNPMGPAIRSRLWNEYTDLTAEARRLKEILEEQSSFASEQIDLAVQALEEELAQFSTLLQQAKNLSFLEDSPTLGPKADLYNQVQKELSLLNTFATRLSALRKEIFHTDLRIRQKSKLLKRLADLSEKIFPRRKELIEEVSRQFSSDIQNFVQTYFQEGRVVGAPYFALREEIKSLQSLAKAFTLNSETFNQTRLKLSECWDFIRAAEADRRQEISQRKQLSSDNAKSIQRLIDEIAPQAASLSLKELEDKIDFISQEMRKTDLQKEDVRTLRDALFQLKAPHLAASEERLRERESSEKEKLRVRKERIQTLKDQIDQLMKEAETLEFAALVERQEYLTSEISHLELSKIEKQQMDRSLRTLKDLVTEKKERSLLSLSADQLQTLEQLRQLLQEKKGRRKEIKDQVETYRKALSGSGLDFEKAMAAQEMLDQEKELLEKINSGIAEIEEKIEELEQG